MLKICLTQTLALVSASIVFAQPAPNASESGAVNLYTNGGSSFGFPAVQAAVVVPGVGSAISPVKKTLPTVGVGATIRAWKYLTPFADFTVIDTGQASAQVGSLRSEVQADTFMFHGGLRVVGGTSRIRPYAQFGGGVLHQTLKGNFIAGGSSTSATDSASVASLTYGAGAQFFVGRRWGSTVGFDGYHVNQPLIGAGQNFSRLSFGIFYQTKSAVR